jgi:hypothetical protein
VYFIETSLVFLRNKNILYDIKQCTVRQSETICIQIMQLGKCNQEDNSKIFFVQKSSDGSWCSIYYIILMCFFDSYVRSSLPGEN